MCKSRPGTGNFLREGGLPQGKSVPEGSDKGENVLHCCLEGVSSSVSHSTVVGTKLCSGMQVMHVLRTLHLFASQFDGGVDQNDSNLRRC